VSAYDFALATTLLRWLARISAGFHFRLNASPFSSELSQHNDSIASTIIKLNPSAAHLTEQTVAEHGPANCV